MIRDSGYGTFAWIDWSKLQMAKSGPDRSDNMQYGDSADAGTVRNHSENRAAILFDMNTKHLVVSFYVSVSNRSH
jgi:hypothetical protein